MKKHPSSSAPAPVLPAGAMRLRHAPLTVHAAARARLAWSTPLPAAGRIQLTSADGHALLVDRAGVTVLEPDAAADAAAWRRIDLPPGRPGTAVAGPFPWVCDAGRVMRWTVSGAVEDLPIRASAALALDARRILVAPDDARGELALCGDGAEVWRAKATLADACPVSAESFVAGVPGDPTRVALLDLASGRARWKSNAGPHELASVVAARGGELWIAGMDRMLFSLRLDTGRVAHGVDTGIRPPTGAVDAHGDLQICHERRWVTASLGASPEVRERRAVANGPYVDPPVPTAGGGLLVRSGRGGLWLLDDASEHEVLPAGRMVAGVASAGERLYVLEEGSAPTAPMLHAFDAPS